MVSGEGSARRQPEVASSANRTPQKSWCVLITIELGRLHDRQVGGLDSFDDLARGDRLGAPGDVPRADNGGRSAPRATGKKCAIICSLAKP
jgi:hypothetical protein